MPFDALLMLRDGLKDAVQATESPDSTTIDGTRGWRIVDLGSDEAMGDRGETGVKGLAAVMILPTADPTATIDLIIQASNSSTFATGDEENCVTFPQVAAADTPALHIRRFATEMRYVRSYLVIGTADAGKIAIFLSPYPWKVL